ncbi:cupin domain-containing protein [Pontibacterium granulatum]|uniref:cupin domain-containing protein n=1 Tax=Pontibacterium granulatum TaxID=2036029 RepID=UPI00249C5DA5|nr:cupin domain-containing protein [Pontibacterium granulatum]MDI3326643.1 cupin domain-containing protein [Pontibacterium granulatum]
MSADPALATPNVQIDNERVIVTEWTFEPGTETGWHRHGYDYVIIPGRDGKLLLKSEEGEVVADLKAGQSYYRSVGVEHNVVNVNDFEFSFVEVELK